MILIALYLNYYVYFDEHIVKYYEIQPVHPKGNQSGIYIGSTDTEAEVPILWPHDAKSQLTGKGPDAGKY